MFASLKDALEDLKKGKAIILVDDDNRENEGDIIFAASKASYDLVKFLVNEVRGLICLPLSEEIARTLNLGLMVQDNTDRHHTAFTQSVDAFDTTTGISVADRLLTIQKLGDPNTKPEDLRRPGHVFPLIAKKDGVFVRRGHTEGCVDLLKMAGLYEVGVVCEILNPSGEMARLSTTLPSFAKEHDLKIISIGQIYNERLKHESTIEPIAEALLPTKLGSFTIEGFKDKFTAEEAVVLKKGDLNGAKSPLVRIHSQCLTGDVFHSLRCDCGEQLDYALRAIEKEGEGMIIYSFQEGRNIGILNKIKAYALQDKGLDTVEANVALGFLPDERTYMIVEQILKYYKLKKIRLLTNNPDKVKAIEELGIHVQRDAIIMESNSMNEKYFKTKKEKMGHLFDN